MNRNKFIMILTLSKLIITTGIQSTNAVETDGTMIGKIERFHSKDIYLRSLWGEETAAEGRIIREGDKLFTVAHQYFKAKLNDRTIMTVGPSTQIEIRNWSKRNSDKKLIREIYLKNGIVWFQVNKVYSQTEPFLLSTDQGVVAVRGTQFIVETGEGGHLISSRILKSDTYQDERNETEVHTLEGEVFFAKTIEQLWSKDERVIINAGKTSLIRSNMSKPQPAVIFDLPLFQKYFARAMEGLPLTINMALTREKRVDDLIKVNVQSARSPASEINEPKTEDEMLDAPVLEPSSASKNMSPRINNDRRRHVLPKSENSKY